MKIFKKAISLVLVFAMLASFAGMTGYKYSPMSIEAEAKHFKTAGGAEITMWSTIYKINHDYTMTYPDKDDSSVSHTSDSGDYAIPQVDGYNELGYTLVFPEGTTQFNAGCSIDGVYWTSYGTLTSTANPSYWSSGKAVMNRPGNDAMYWDYGALYRDNLLGKGVKGFRDIGKIKWRVVYTCNGTEYTEYWDVDVLDWDRQSAGNSQAWNGAATSSKPTDSHAGKNELTNIHVPATLYLNGTSVVNSLSYKNSGTQRFDTYIMFTLPSGGYDPKVYQVNINDEVISNELTFTKLGNSGNTHKWNVSSSTLPAGTTEVYYRIEYKVDVTDPLGNPDTVTYTQYAASFVKTIPNYNAVWRIRIGNKVNSGDQKHRSTFYHEMSFLPSLVYSGVDVSVDYRLTSLDSAFISYIDGSHSETYTGYASSNWIGTNQNEVSTTFSWNNAIGVLWTDESSNTPAYWPGGTGRGYVTTSNSIGGVVTYDPSAKTVTSDSSYTLTNVTAASIGMNFTFHDAIADKHAGHSDYKWAKRDAYTENWYSVSSDSGFTYGSTSYGASGSTPIKLSSVYSSTTYTYSGMDWPSGLGGGTADPQVTYYNYSMPGILASSITKLRAACTFMTCSTKNGDAMTEFAYGFHMDLNAVDRSTPHDLIEAARKNNYIKAEMDATWWDSYRKSVFAAYVNCGNLTAAETTSFSTNFSKPVYKFADYSALNTSILTPVEWDRGGKVKVNSDGNFIDEDGNEVKTTEDKWYEKLQAEDNYIPWGASYGKWNSKTYATDYGKVTDEDNVYLAAYDLVFTEDTEAETMEFKVSNTPRTGAYYYTTATWNAYTAARDYAVEVYNYPNSTVATFDYDTAYPAKAATQEGNQANVGLACYHQAEIDAAVSNLQTKRAALVKYDVNNNNYDINQYYRKLLSQLGSIAYDNSAKALFDFNTKHGFAGITSEIYDEATIVFRASAPEDVFDYVWTAAESSDPGYLGDGHVKVDEDGNPLYKKEDGTIVLASEAGDVGILEFPRADGTLRPVGKGNTFSQLYFDNSAKSQYAVTSARAALRNRLRWRMGGGGAAGYEYLGMVEGVYNQEGLTEDKLNNNPTQYFWSGKEHQDDILREVYALYRVKTTLRLAANYREVVEVLNNENNYIPSYDIGGTAYKAKNLQNETMFQTYTPASAWDTVSITANGATYHTSGKTWYTEDSWAGFIADRNKLAAMIYNGSTRTSTSSPYGDASEIGQEYVYDSGVANKYYTYDVELSSGVSITNTYYTNGYYQTGGHLAAEYQDDINQAVKDYKAWFNGDTTDGKELKLKDLDAYTWEAYNETTVSSIEEKVAGLYNSLLTEQQEVVHFVPETDENGNIIGDGAKLEETEVSKYDPEELAELAALADVVTALHRVEGEITEDDYGKKFNNGMSLADQAVAFDKALAEFDAKYKEVHSSVGYVDTTGWDGIFTHLTKLNGGTAVTTNNIDDIFGTIYTDEGATIKTQIQEIVDRKIVTQDEYNQAVRDLFTLLDQSLTSIEVVAAAKAALDEAGTTFTKYNPYDVENSTNNSLVDAETAPLEAEKLDGITVVYKYMDEGRNSVISYADGKKTTEYRLLATYISNINNEANTIRAKAGVYNNGAEYTNLAGKIVPCELVDRGVQTDVLEAAIAEATDKLGAGGTTEVVFPSKPEQNYPYNMSSIESVAELQEVVRLANEASKTGSTADQLAIDKLVFAIIEEMDNSRYVVSQNPMSYYRTWTHTYNDDRTVIVSSTFTDNAIVFTEQIWETLLHKKLSNVCMDMGLEYAIAHHDLLALEIKVPREADKTLGVWDADGNIIDSNGNVVTSDYYNNGYGKVLYTSETWKDYTDAIAAAYSLIAVQEGTLESAKLRADKQGDINAAAQLIYDKREALQYNSFATHTPGHSQATKFYNDVMATIKATVNVYDYDVVTGKSAAIAVELYDKDSYAEIEVALDNFYALYVGNAQTPPEAQNTEQAYEEMKQMANIIYEAISEGQPYPDFWTSEKEYPCDGRYFWIYPRTMDDAAFQVGWQSLLDDFIAGEYTNGQYTSALLSTTQVAKLDELLDTANVFIKGDYATVELVNNFVGAVEAVFTYTTTTNATDMKFAVAMKEQIFGFMDMKFSYGGVSFYNGGATAQDYVFLRNIVDGEEGIKDQINGFFETKNNWPYIYQVNDLVVSQDDGTKIYSVTNPADAESFTSIATGISVANQIQTIFDTVGNKSNYYVDILDSINMSAYHTEAYNWIMREAITTIDGKTYVLADLEADVENSSTTSDGEATVNYDVAKDTYWYSDGYGLEHNDRRYYLFAGGVAEDKIIGSSVNGWFKDSGYNTVNQYLEGLPTTFMQFFDTENSTELTSGYFYAPIAGYDNKEEDARFANSYTLAQEIIAQGWSASMESGFLELVNAEQQLLDNAAQVHYENIRGLKLLPATAAYREIEIIYQAAIGDGLNTYTVNFNNTEDDHITADTNEKVKADVAVFYNNTSNFLTQLGETNYHWDEGASFGTSASLPSQYDKNSDEWNAMIDYYDVFKNTFTGSETNPEKVITIDRAAEVEAKKEEMIALIKALPLVRFDFTQLERLLKAFFANGSSEMLNDLVGDEVLEGDYWYGTPFDGAPQYYKSEFYTHNSLLEVLSFLLSANVITPTLYNAAQDKNYEYKFNFTKELSGGEFFNNPTYYDSDEEISLYGDDAISHLIEDLVGKIMSLRLKAADTTELDVTIEKARKIIEEESNLYVQDGKWNEFILAYGDEETYPSALFTKMMCEIAPEDAMDVSSYYSEAMNSGDVSAANKALIDAIAALTRRSDSTAPHMSIYTINTEVANFYAANEEKLASKDPEGADNPITGSYFVPNSGYSLMVYTNELNPRIVMTVQDFKGIVDASKKEKISVSAARTSGVEANLIYGTQNAAGEIVDIAKDTVTNGGNPVNNYINSLSDAEDSKVFAILAPKFVASTADKKAPNAQAAMYTLTVSDGASQMEGVADGTQDNFVREVDLGIDGLPNIKVVDDNKTEITIYVYYHNVMSETNDEGIDVNGSATQAITDSTQVASVYMSDEPDFNGTTWRNGLLLKRSFSDRHSVWEFVSPVLDSKDSGVPGYYDYTFKYLNTGSFYYVINRTAETMILEDISDEQLKKETAINKAILAEYGEATLVGKMNYAKATDAKQLMIDYINGEIENGIVVGEKAVDVFATLKASDNFYSYGDYERDDVTGKIEYYDNGEPKWINWAQAIGGKVENGDLVFIHVVDRWGNVVNRIVEITNLDKEIPGVDVAIGVVTIDESGGSGVGNIQIGNGMTSEGEITDVADYLINSTNSQNVKVSEGSKMVVNTSTDSVTLSGLISGRTYYINVYDNACNVKCTSVKADEKGSIVIKVKSNGVETGEENGVTPNSTTFTLNGTDTIILNSGEASSVINADVEGNVFANRYIKHYVTTTDSVTAIKTIYQDGTAEEFTAEKTVVTDNGDGTLTWEIRRKFAEGEHKYKVYAKVNGEYESFFATATINATNKKVRFECTTVGQGAMQLFYSGALYTQDVSNYISTDIPYGAKVTISANAYTTYEGCEFYYWINNTTDRIINTANVYEFKAVTNADYIAQFTNNSTCIDGKKFVVYVNNAKNVIERFELADGDSYTVPTGPVLPDYTFMGWSMTKAEVLESDKDTIIVEPIYELNASNTVTITEGNYTATGAGTYTAQDNQRAVVTISTSAKDGDGKEFLYWLDADTDEIISYDRTYSFFCVKDTELTPVYGDASTITAEPIVRITEVKFNALSGKVSFFAERSVPEEFVILQTGIVVTKTESIGTNEEVFVVGGTSTAAGTSTSTANNGYYSANTAVATGQTVWARAYVIYETADGEIFEAYGPVVSYTVD